MFRYKKRSKDLLKLRRAIKKNNKVLFKINRDMKSMFEYTHWIITQLVKLKNILSLGGKC
jgi:hypothetical protein